MISPDFASKIATLVSPSTRKVTTSASPSGATEMTSEPDGKAIGCNPFEVGSTPTGVSLNAITDGSTRTLWLYS